MKKLLILIFISGMAFAQDNLVWKLEGPKLPGYGYSWSTPLIMDNILFWAGQDKGFAAVDASTGSIKWVDTVNFYNGTYDSPVGYDGAIFIQRNDYMDNTKTALLALSASDGQILWQKNQMSLVERAAKPISILNKSIYIVSTDTLFCLDINNGSTVWKIGRDYNNVLIDYADKNLYAIRRDSTVLEVLDNKTGALQWRYGFGEGSGTLESMSYTVYNSKQYLVLAPARDYYGKSTKFYCLDLDNKSVLWSSDKLGAVGNKSAPVILGNRVFAGTEKSADTTQNIIAFGLETGGILWEKPARISGATNSPYVLALDGKVFYENSTGTTFAVMCADPLTGNAVWNSKPEFENPWPLTWGSPLLYDNKIYLAKDGEGIFCFNVGQLNGAWPVLGGNVFSTNSYNADLVSGIEKIDDEIPAGFSLEQNYPNPFNPSTNIRYSVPSESVVLIKVYDVLGNELAELVNSRHTPGSYMVAFDGKNLASGMYVYTIKSGDFFHSQKMMLLK